MEMRMGPSSSSVSDTLAFGEEVDFSVGVVAGWERVFSLLNVALGRKRRVGEAMFSERAREGRDGFTSVRGYESTQGFLIYGRLHTCLIICLAYWHALSDFGGRWCLAWSMYTYFRLHSPRT